MINPRSKKIVQSIKLKSHRKTIKNRANKISKKIEVNEGLERITITIPRSMKYAVDDLIIDRKRQKKTDRSASAMIRAALKVYLKKYEMRLQN